MPIAGNYDEYYPSADGSRTIHAHMGGEATEGKVNWGITNTGETDLRLARGMVSISEGGENNRIWSTVGYLQSDNDVTVKHAIYRNLGVQADATGSGYNRSHGYIEFERDDQPVLATRETMYANIDISNPTNTDTTKGYVELWFRPLNGSTI